MKCRFCGNNLEHVFIDLVNAPPSNSILWEQELNEPEIFYPLKTYVCSRCYLVQIDEYKKSDEIFDDKYCYFSSFSSTWLEHSQKYTEMIVPKLGLDNNSFVIEIASNDGYLLQYFKEKYIKCLGIEPTRSTAEAARMKGIETIEEFFGVEFAKQLVEKKLKADLIIGNNVLAHVPDINDFVAGLKIALKDSGTITMEFPHLLNLIECNQFDTIYHEHFSYFSFLTVQKIFFAHGLTLYDVEELPTHGGSLRIYAKHSEDETKPIFPNIFELKEKEIVADMNKIEYYSGFQAKANKVKYDLLIFLMLQKQAGKKVAAYGAAAKGNTMLNYCGIKSDLIEFAADLSPYKQGRYMPGSHLPILQPEEIKKRKPDYVLILPWNIKDEIMEQLGFISEWGGKFVMAIPKLEIL